MFFIKVDKRITLNTIGKYKKYIDQIKFWETKVIPNQLDGPFYSLAKSFVVKKSKMTYLLYT